VYKLHCLCAFAHISPYEIVTVLVGFNVTDAIRIRSLTLISTGAFVRIVDVENVSVPSFQANVWATRRLAANSFNPSDADDWLLKNIFSTISSPCFSVPRKVFQPPPPMTVVSTVSPEIPQVMSI